MNFVKNKRPMGHIAHLRKQLKSINTYDYNITLIKRTKQKIFNFIIIYSFFHLNKIESTSPKDALCQDWLKLAQWFCRRKIFIFVNVFSPFPNNLSFEKGRGLLFEQSGSGEEDS